MRLLLEIAYYEIILTIPLWEFAGWKFLEKWLPEWARKLLAVILGLAIAIFLGVGPDIKIGAVQITFPHDSQITPFWQVMLFGSLLVIYAYVKVIRAKKSVPVPDTQAHPPPNQGMNAEERAHLLEMREELAALRRAQSESQVSEQKRLAEAQKGDPKPIAPADNEALKQVQKLEQRISELQAEVRKPPTPPPSTQSTGTKDRVEEKAQAANEPRLKDSEAYFDRGCSYYNNGDYDSAIADFNEAIRLDPEHADANLYRGLAYLEKGDHDQALSDISESFSLVEDAKGEGSKQMSAHEPDDDMFHHRGLAYYRKGNYDRAIADMSEAIKLKPDGKKFSDRGTVYLRKGDYDHAISDFNRVLAFEPKSALAYANRAMAYFGKENFHQTIADCNEAIRLKSDFVQPYYFRGNALERLGRTDEAIRDYKHVLELDSRLTDAADALKRLGVTE